MNTNIRRKSLKFIFFLKIQNSMYFTYAKRYVIYDSFRFR